MPELPDRPDFNQLRHQAKDLLHAAQNGDDNALARIRAVSSRLILASAQLAIAREYGFPSWAKLKLEVERRDVLNSRDTSRLANLLAEHPELATTKMEHWCDHKSADPIGYMAMMRFDHDRLGLPPDLTGTGAVARALIDAGAPVDGHPGDKETPLITAASYGDIEVAKVLIEAGADIEAVSAPDSGGVPDGNALRHAAVFGMTDVLDLLLTAGARIDTLPMAAAAGDISAWQPAKHPLQDRIRALVFAADHQRLDVIDQLIQAGTPVDAVDTEWGCQALKVAAQNGRPDSVGRLLEHGADPNHRDSHGRAALDWCQLGNSPGHSQVGAILHPLTRTKQA